MLSGVRSEFSHHGIAARLGQKRADLKHQPLDPIIVTAPWLVAGGAAYFALRTLARRRRA